MLADRFAALVAAGLAEPSKEKPQIVVDLRNGRHGAAGIVAARPLIDRYGGLQAFDQIDVGPFQLMQELPGVDREAFDVLALALGVEGVEGKRAFARPAGPGNDDEAIAGDVEIDILEVMHARPTDANALVANRLNFRSCSTHTQHSQGAVLQSKLFILA